MSNSLNISTENRCESKNLFRWRVSITVWAQMTFKASNRSVFGHCLRTPNCPAWSGCVKCRKHENINRKVHAQCVVRTAHSLSVSAREFRVAWKWVKIVHMFRHIFFYFFFFIFSFYVVGNMTFLSATVSRRLLGDVHNGSGMSLWEMITIINNGWEQPSMEIVWPVQWCVVLSLNIQMVPKKLFCTILTSSLINSVTEKKLILEPREWNFGSCSAISPQSNDPWI